MDQHSVYWRLTTTTHSAESRSPLSRSFIYFWSYYEYFLVFLKFRTLCNNIVYLDVQFLFLFFSDLQCCLSVLDTTGIWVFARNFRNSTLLLLLSRTVHMLDMSWRLTVCVNTSVSSGNALFKKKNNLRLSVTFKNNVPISNNVFRQTQLVYYNQRGNMFRPHCVIIRPSLWTS